MLSKHLKAYSGANPGANPYLTFNILSNICPGQGSGCGSGSGNVLVFYEDSLEFILRLFLSSLYV